MNYWVAGVIVISVWIFGLFILRGVGDCIQRLRRIENDQRGIARRVEGIRREAYERSLPPSVRDSLGR